MFARARAAWLTYRVTDFPLASPALILLHSLLAPLIVCTNTLRDERGGKSMTDRSYATVASSPAEKSKVPSSQTRSMVVPPTPAKEPDPTVFRDLFRLLNVSDADVSALSSVFASIGCSSLEDLGFLQESDFTEFHASVPAMTKRKVLLIGEFIQRGGNLVDVECMNQIFSLVQTAKLTCSSIVSEKAKKCSTFVPTTTDSKQDILELNVGGNRFTTSRQTLCRVPGSFLEAMFSGRHEKPALKSQDGCYFIDRNGTHFQYILDFLRVGCVVALPPGEAPQEELAIEADFYGLSKLVESIRMPKIDVDAFLEDDVKSLRRKEDELRLAFRTRSIDNLDVHHGLIPLFCRDHGIRPLPIRHEPLDGAHDKSLMMDLRKRAPSGTAVTATNLAQFRSNFNRLHPNILHRLQNVLLEESIIIAGGSVLNALTATPGVRTEPWWGVKSDIDLFLHCNDRFEANRVAKRVFDAIAVDQETWVVLRARGVITIHNWAGTEAWNRHVDEKIQIVLRLYDSPVEVLLGFDCDCCCCAYDGQEVWVTPRWLYALRTGVNVLNPLHAWPNKASYELRLTKYAYRGFAILVPGLDWKRVDMNTIRKKPLRKLNGLARLAKISLEMELPRESGMYVYAYPREPATIDNLRGHFHEEYSEIEKLCAGASGYDEDIEDLIIPSVYCDGDPSGYMWLDYVGGDSANFPLAADCREEAWEEIDDASENPVENVPDLLYSAWETEKRSREYLNATLDKYDLDNLYYHAAYEPSS